MKPKRLFTLCLATSVCCIAIAAAFYASIDRPTSINPLRIAVAKVSLGSTADEADAAMGMSPVSVTDTNGYLLSPVVMLTPENELAPKDKIEHFSLLVRQDQELGLD